MLGPREFTWKLLSTDPVEVSKPYIPFDIAPETAVVLANRGVRPADVQTFLKPSLEALERPGFLAEIDAAASRLARAVETKEHVRVFGDYDADGITSTVLMKDVLERLGCTVSIEIPQRDEGYSLSLQGVENADRAGASLILTVDCGSKSYSAAQEAHRRGIDLIVTDHHEVGEERPQCIAFINPHWEQSGQGTGAGLAGVGVALYTAIALRAELDRRGFFDRPGNERPNLRDLLDLVALGTIADVAPLTGLNRILVSVGLEVLSKAERPGMKALLQVSGVGAGSTVSATQVAFRLAPRLNAGGRMGDASRGVRLLSTRDYGTARALAAELDQENNKRRELQKRLVDQAVANISAAREESASLVIFGDDWPRGILGLVAGTLSEMFCKPSVVFTRIDELYIGSARSAPWLNLYDALGECRDLLKEWGGHRDAAGLTVEKDKFEQFKERLEEVVAKYVPEGGFERTLELDCELDPGRLTFNLVSQLENLAPYGQGNPPPLFLIKGLQVMDSRKVGNDGKTLLMSLRCGGSVVRSVGFGLAEKIPDKGRVIDVAATPFRRIFNGGEEIQLELKDLRAHT